MNNDLRFGFPLPVTTVVEKEFSVLPKDNTENSPSVAHYATDGEEKIKETLEICRCFLKKGDWIF